MAYGCQSSDRERYRNFGNPSNIVRDPTNIGGCDYQFEFSDCGDASVGLIIAIPSSDAPDGYCWGDVNKPRWDYLDYECTKIVPSSEMGNPDCTAPEDSTFIELKPLSLIEGRAGFELPAVIQFFNLDDESTRAHSSINFHWDSIGKLIELEKFNDGSIIRTSLWRRDRSLDYHISSDFLLGSSDSSDCVEHPLNTKLAEHVGLPSSSDIKE